MLTLNKLKKLATKLLCGETGCLCIFFSPPNPVIPHSPVDYHQVFKPILYFQPSPVQSDSQLCPPLLNPFFGMHNSLTCDLWDAMPHQRSLTLIPREPEDFPRADNHSKNVPLPTYLVWLQAIYYNSRFVFIHVNTIKVLLVVKTLIKKYKASATLISSNHESKN